MPTHRPDDAVAPWLDRVAPRSRQAARIADTDRGAAAIFGAGVAVYVVLAVLMLRGTGPFVDEIQFFAQDRGLRPSALLQPLNGHLVLLQRVLYAVEWRVLGGGSYLVAQVAEVAGVVLAAALLGLLVRRSAGPGVGALGAVVVLLLGSAWELNFVISGLGNVAALSAGLGALLALEGDDRRGDVLAAVLLLLAVASFTIALAFVAGVAIQLVVTRGGLRRLWIVVPALVAYVPWLVWSRTRFDAVSMVDLGNVPRLPQLVAREAASALGAVFGLDYPLQSKDFLRWFSTSSPFGAPLALAAAVVLVLVLVRRPVARSARLWGGLAVLAGFWMLIALSVGPVRGTDSARYSYIAAALLVLAAARLAHGSRPTAAALIGVGALVAVSVAGNLDRLRDAATVYRPASFALRATYSGLDAAGPAARPGSIQAGGPLGGLQLIDIRPYLRAAGTYGSQGYSPATLTGRPEADRAVADATIVEVERLGLRAGSSSLAGCLRVPAAADGTRTFRVPAGGVRLVADATATVGLRRFAARTTSPAGTLAARRGATLALPRDASTAPWTLVVGAGPRSVAACPA